MAGKKNPLGKKTKQGKTAPKTGALQVRKARDGERDIKAGATIKKRRGESAKATPNNTVSPIQRREPDQDTESKADRVIREEIPEALAYFLDVYGRLGRG